MKIIHFHVETKSNIGDAAIVFSIRDILNSNFKIAKYTSKNIKDLKKRDYPRVIDTTMKGPRGSKIIPKGKLFDKFYKKIKNKLDNKLLKKINGHDLMIIGGGGLYYKSFFPLNNELIKKIKIPIVTFGLGYNHNLWDRNLSQKQIESIIILNKKVKLSSVRDLKTKKFLKNLGFDAYYIGDPAIFLKSKKVKVRFRKKIKIGINIAYHQRELQDKYTEKILTYYTKFLKELEEKYNPQFFYLKHNSSEEKIIKKLKKRYPNITVCNYGPYQLKFIYENLDLVICMMLHSSILAFSSSTPIINIAYNDKNYAFMKIIGQEDKVIDIRRLNSEKMHSLIDIIPHSTNNNFVKIKKEFERKTNEFVNKIKSLV